MTIYKTLLKELLYELEHRDEVMVKNAFTPDMYYAYMTGRMGPVIRWLWLLTADRIEIGG